jgi:hypothetical protein
MPELLRRTSIPPDYVALMVRSSITTHDADTTLAAVERAFADPRAGSNERRTVAQDLFHEPGTATARALAELYSVLELEAPAAAAVPTGAAAHGRSARARAHAGAVQ